MKRARRPLLSYLPSHRVSYKLLKNEDFFILYDARVIHALNGNKRLVENQTKTTGRSPPGHNKKATRK